MNILEEIVLNTKTKLEEKKLRLPFNELLSQINLENIEQSNFKKNLENKSKAIIAEIKKASPSAGVISENFDPISKAKEYESFGASALSILTEEDYFLGSIEYLKQVKAITNLPILRKDFIIDALQVYQSKMIGADCILLIASALSHKLFEELYSLAASLNLDVLAEVHNLDELDFVKSLGIKLLGINNRNLKTFQVDINTSVHLSDFITDEETVIVSESGIHTPEDVSRLNKSGIFTFLIGEHLIKSTNASEEIGEFINAR